MDKKQRLEERPESDIKTNKVDCTWQRKFKPSRNRRVVKLRREAIEEYKKEQLNTE